MFGTIERGHHTEQVRLLFQFGRAAKDMKPGRNQPLLDLNELLGQLSYSVIVIVE